MNNNLAAIEKLFGVATPKKAKLKMGIFGESGTGKTFTALKIASGLGKKISFIDTEFNADIYGKDFDFKIAKTRSLDTVVSALESDYIKNFDVVIIDSITHLWEDAQESYLKKLAKSNNPKKKAQGENGDLQFQDWRYIKRPYKMLVKRMLELDAHVIFCGREAKDYGKHDGQLIVVGNRMDSERGTPYEPTILLRMILEKGINTAEIIKDRTNTLTGPYKNPGIEILFNAIKKLDMDVTQPKKLTDDTPFEEMPEEKKSEILKAITSVSKKLAKITESSKETILSEELEGKELEDLTYGELKALYSRINEKVVAGVQETF